MSITETEFQVIVQMKLIFKLLIMKEEIRIPFQLDILLFICPKNFNGNYK